MAGLLAAHVLSDHFETVTILERDEFPANVADRRGVPQGRHAHGLLAKGAERLAAFFPGIREDLAAEGAIALDMGTSMLWYHYGGFKASQPTGLIGTLQSRALLETAVRRRVLALPNVIVIQGRDAEGLMFNDDRTRVTGVYAGEPIEADLVIDCTGRGSQTSAMLRQAGYKAPPESVVKVDVGYSTRIYRRTATDLPPGKQVLMVSPEAPRERRMACCLPIEGDRWYVSLGGWHKDYPPTDAAGFLEFARSLPVPDVFNLISRAEPLTDAVPHRLPSNLRRHYEKLERFPEGLLVLGDGVCSFNPIFGQGMTSAALQATALDDLLRRGSAARPYFASVYFEAVAKVVDIPWASAVSEDFRFAETTGPKPGGTDFINRYVAAVHRAATRDSYVFGEFLKVMNLLARPESLFHPKTLWRVWRANREALCPKPLDVHEVGPALGAIRAIKPGV